MIEFIKEKKKTRFLINMLYFRIDIKIANMWFLITSFVLNVFPIRNKR